MRTALGISLLVLCFTPLGHAEGDAKPAKTTTIRYVEGFQDVTVLGRTYAIFQSEDEPTKRFRIYVWPGLAEDIDPNTHNIIQILRSFPTTPKDVPQTQRASIGRAFVPAGVVTFEVPADAPDKKIKDWKLKTLKLGLAEQGGPANQSQPFRSETERTSPAVGSGR